ncbi:flavodoxin [Clostridium bovifaecis]|uniref:Flavodoxin n=1 Tax=Clostridium bovifaecis TaxID=2184719 RepID=A0A6I6EWB3_9CLOT|nr:flavodoxin [Clostridium bovifaecis]
MKTLIVYGSRHGCAEKCSKVLKSKLDGEVTILHAKKGQIFDISPFDKIIIGGSIYAGRIQKEIAEFCNVNLKELKKKKIGLFICCMNKDNADTQLNSSYPPELLNMAVAKDNFGGEFLFEKMSVFERFIVKMATKSNKGILQMDGKKNISIILDENIVNFAHLINNA